MGERERELRRGLRELRAALARLPDLPEPLTAGELAAGRRNEGGRIPPPPLPEAPPRDTVAGALGRLAAGRRTSADLVAEARRRAEAAADLRAFIHLSEGAARAARRSDERRRRADEPGRPLEGVPLTVKDIVDVRGLVTTSGSRFPRRARRTAPAWRRLREAGAILLGKTNLQEFAYGVTGDNPTFGRVRNPADPGRITGGSSSGSAAAVAAGIGAGSVGTDTGGSIRIPAALTGVFGFKPSYGSVSRAGVTPLSWSLDHVGPMARSAFDVALLWEVLAGVGGGTALSAVRPGEAGKNALEGVRVGVPENFFYTDLTRPVREAAEGVVAACASLGAEVAPVRIPEVEFAGVSRNVIAFAEAAAVHRARMEARPEAFSPDVAFLLRLGARIPAGDLILAGIGRRLVTDALVRVFEDVDVLVVPTTPAGAPPAGDDLLATGEALRPGLIRLVGPFNLTGLPSLQAPAGRDGEGMPLGVQLVGPPGGDAAVLRLGCWLEARGALADPPRLLESAVCAA